MPSIPIGLPPEPPAPPYLTVAPTNVNLGPQVAGGALSQTITITARGSGPALAGINIISITIAGAGWVLSGAGWVPFKLLLNTSQTVVVSITEPANGTYLGTLTIVSAAGTYVINLKAVFAAGLNFAGQNGWTPDKPGQQCLITAASEVGTTVTLTLNNPLVTSGSGQAISVLLGIVGYDGTWEIGTISPDGKTLTYTASASALAPFNSSVSSPPGLLISLDIIFLHFINQTGAPVTITGIAVNDPNFTFPVFNSSNGGAATFPVTIANGNQTIIEACYNHAELGLVNVLFTVANNSSVPSLPITLFASTVALFPFDPLTGTNLLIAFGATDGTVRNADFLPSNTGIASTLVFNDPLWDQPGMEKTLFRLEVFYENYGVCTLTLLLQSFRQALNGGNGGFDQQTQTITIGDITNDQSDRSAFFDREITGELIIATLTRPGNGGACSLTGFTPHFLDGGEKVEGQ